MSNIPTPVDALIEYLNESLSDEVMSKSERKTLKATLAEHPLSQDQLNFIRSKVYELALEKATPENYRFVLEWVKSAINTLIVKEELLSEAFFSPGDACRTTIIQQIDKAISKIRICVFTISDDTIAEAIIASHKRGIDIRILTDNDKSLDEGSDIERLARERIAIKMDNTSNHMHHKFMVADDRLLITGSYNWTRSAARFNHENIVVTDNAGTVKSFLHQFDKLWGEMTPYGE